MQGLLVALVSCTTAVQALSIHAINGIQFLSPYNGQSVTNVTGIVTAKASNGLYLRNPKRACDSRLGNGLFVYDSALGANESIAVGDTLVLSGEVEEYRSSDGYLYSTELTSPVVDAWTQGGDVPEPRVLGADGLDPPTVQYTSLDNGDIFGVPNAVNLISAVNPTLEPEKYGLDFWKSLNSELVTAPNPVAVSKPNSYGEVWVVGDWPTSGMNSRGGLTLSDKDANPEAIIIGSPLDGSDSDSTYKIGDRFENVTGVIHYQYGFYYLLPLESLVKVSSVEPALPPPTTLISTGLCSGVTVGDYNIENFYPSDTDHVADVAGHIVNYLLTPDVMFIQEVQDNDGPTDDGVVDSSQTLAALITAITDLGGVEYSFTVINPEDDEDGGQPGGNIRVAYLYNPAVVALNNPNPGGATDANEVLTNTAGNPTLKYNPGRIDPTNAAWEASRKPLVAEWKTVDGNHVFFTVNVHWESKGGSSSLQGDERPPVNSPVEKRTMQANLTASFIAQILEKDADARVVMGGDLNEYSVVQPVTTFASVSGMVDLDIASGIPVDERYSYTYGSNMEELDHLFVSPSIADLSPLQEHIHVNTWVSYDDQVSDHDPAVALVNVCGTNIAVPGSSPTTSATTTVTSTTSMTSTVTPTTTMSTVTTSPTPTSVCEPTASATLPSTAGNIEVVTPSEDNGGHLITAGVWYRGGGTAAKYTAAMNSDGLTFTLKTSKGYCEILSGDSSLFCDSSVETPSSFGYDGTYITYDCASTFYSDAVPSGSEKGTVYTTENAVTLQLTWSPV